MRIISGQDGRDSLWFSWGAEEAMILFQPGEMLRATLERDFAALAQARFLTRIGAGVAGGMLAILPRAGRVSWPLPRPMKTKGCRGHPGLK